jgi:hypothetical protein
VRASQVAATVGTVALGAAAAGTAAHVIALGQSAIVAAGAVALLPAALAGAVGTAIAAKVVFGGLGEAWKQTGAAAAAGGGATVDIAHKVQMAQRSVRDATQALADAQRDALSAQDALTRAREDEAERLSDLSRTVAGARLKNLWDRPDYLDTTAAAWVTRDRPVFRVLKILKNPNIPSSEKYYSVVTRARGRTTFNLAGWGSNFFRVARNLSV